MALPTMGNPLGPGIRSMRRTNRELRQRIHCSSRQVTVTRIQVDTLSPTDCKLSQWDMTWRLEVHATTDRPTGASSPCRSASVTFTELSNVKCLDLLTFFSQHPLELRQTAKTFQSQKFLLRANQNILLRFVLRHRDIWPVTCWPTFRESKLRVWCILTSRLRILGPYSDVDGALTQSGASSRWRTCRLRFCGIPSKLYLTGIPLANSHRTTPKHDD